MLPSEIDKLLRDAIKGKWLLGMRYKDVDRVVEPHDYGVLNGSAKLLAYQISRSRSGKMPGWRLFEVSQILIPQTLAQTFPGGRPTVAGREHKWEKLFIRVEPADEDSEPRAFERELSNPDNARLASAVASLGYHHFPQLAGAENKDPAAVVLAAIGMADLEARITLALPWILLEYYDLDWHWLISRAMQQELQNRLGYIVTLARQMAEREGQETALTKLKQAEAKLRSVRSQREDTLCEATMTNAERKWLRSSRSEEARFWNLLTDFELKHSLHEV